MFHIGSESKIYAQQLSRIKESGCRAMVKTANKAFCDLCIIYSSVHKCFIIFGVKKYVLSKLSRSMLIRLAKIGAIAPPSQWKVA